MAETKSTLHVRSNSLPYRPHPIVCEVEEHLFRLKSSEATSTSSSSIFHKLNGLQDLHDAVDMLLQLPQTRQILAQHHGMKSVDELLDGTVLLLDMCTAAKDALMQSTQLINELQSMLRTKHMAELKVEANKHLGSRKATKKAVLKVLRTLKELRHEDNLGSVEKDALMQSTNFINELQSMLRKKHMAELKMETNNHLASRKATKKAVVKLLRTLKGLRNEDNLRSLEKDDQEMSMITMLREVEAVTLKSLEALLFFVSGSKPKSIKSKWSLVDKLMHSKRVASIPEERDTNEFERLDMGLQHLSLNKASNTDDLNSHMENTKSCIVDLDEATENLFRRLIKTRVALLNILSS